MHINCFFVLFELNLLLKTFCCRSTKSFWWPFPQGCCPVPRWETTAFCEWTFRQTSVRMRWGHLLSTCTMASWISILLPSPNFSKSRINLELKNFACSVRPTFAHNPRVPVLLTTYCARGLRCHTLLHNQTPFHHNSPYNVNKILFRKLKRETYWLNHGHSVQRVKVLFPMVLL